MYTLLAGSLIVEQERAGGAIVSCRTSRIDAMRVGFRTVDAAPRVSEPEAKDQPQLISPRLSMLPASIPPARLKK